LLSELKEVMWQEAIKLTLAGLMVALDVVGIPNANDRVLSLANQFGLEDAYQAESVRESETADIAVKLPSAVPYALDELSYPVVEATSAMVMDVETGATLFAQNIDDKRAMASTTKLMTALVVLDECLLSEVVTVQATDVAIEPNIMGLAIGEQVLVEDLLWGLLINSGNDAALTLARHAGGSVDQFVEMMNEKAEALGLTGTHYANPHGLDAPGHHSTARDLAILAREALQDDLIAKIVSYKSATVYSTDGSRSYYLKNTNKLLDSYLPIKGLKTGFTDEAGQSVIELADNGHKIIAIVLNSPDRFQESKILIDWAYDNYYWE